MMASVYVLRFGIQEMLAPCRAHANSIHDKLTHALGVMCRSVNLLGEIDYRASREILESLRARLNRINSGR